MTYNLITGACGGLGGAFVAILAKRGEPLFLTGRSMKRLKLLADKLQAEYPALPVLYYPCDLTSSQSRMAFFDYTDREGVRFHRLINVAGADIQKAFSEYTEDKLVFQIRANFEGAVSFTHAVTERSPLDGKTEFLSIGSMSGNAPMPYFALYSATKKALQQFSIALRTELKGRARVTCVLPGSIPTREDIKKNIQEHGFWTRISAKSPEAVAKASLKAVRRNKRTKVIGFVNHIIYFFTKITPLSIKLKFIARRWKKTEKDAF